ncbi:protein-Npi-phosphohistidine-sugar phosphotransferase [Propionibacterium ruminifibrarum]|uniref:Protein-Npi-phosphohistidine-sugar phosphotransferase n=1 Tax=Propionibacterium ruminifibrarum TaxID=1962131 RepID=A0A375I6H1_9ACTN|nr:PTS sugar transporter subunit IIB [Propionibacterium ruminifibrarum]SPF69458.1 protein-Npi-phosphohistidine-sugar phosphotransferase [Propionibacterium ruminifibrarum]
MNKEVKILIACGSGIATSTVAQEKVKKILAEANIPAKITKGTVSQIQSLANSVDIVMVTTKYPGTIDKPVVQVFGLISGINEDKVAQQVVDTCRAVLDA